MDGTGGNAVEIAAALAEIRDLQDEGGRTMFVHAIGEYLGSPLLVTSHNSPKAYLYNVVVACRDRPGGMDAMLAVVDYLAGGTYAAAFVRRRVGPVADLLASDAEMQIKELLQGFTMPSLTRIYHAAAGDRGMGAPGRLDDAWQAFSILLDANTGPRGLPPHLLFVDLLIRVMDRQASSHTPRADAAWLSARLREWMAEQLAVLRKSGDGRAADLLESFQDDTELHLGDPDLPIYLIIQLEPLDDVAAEERYVRLSHWRQIQPLEWRPEPGEDQVLRFDEVPESVSRLIREAEGGWAYQLDDSLVLEFVLPLDLLSLAPDEWTRDPPEEPYPTPLGMEYEVIVRSHERMYDLTLHRVWRQRWRVLQQAARCMVQWPELERPWEPDRLRGRLMAEPNVVAYVLSSAPDREPGRTELRMALRAGVPVVLWHRGEPPGAQLADVLRDVVERPDLRDLPAQVKRLRGAGPANDVNGPAAVGPLTLLYDNPDHFLGEPQALRLPQG
ncbi:effector-associated domain 2-containing protein [Actinomadura scrupuli]|uniref:VMAP-C domain-containing protein n=1 Tax=Actinomadura scrupuli TaxID=559629 RepID=UPI003D9589CC